jgi:hypothetical protein
MIEAKNLTGRPLVERPNLAFGEGRRVVVLAVPRGVVAIGAKDAGNGYGIASDERAIAREARRRLGDIAEADMWWLRPVSSAAREGEQSAVELKFV